MEVYNMYHVVTGAYNYTQTSGCIVTDSSYIYEFDSINAFNEYITNTPINKTFQWRTLQSTAGTTKFTGTESYEQAQNLLKSGVNDIAKRINDKLSGLKHAFEPVKKQRPAYGMAGYQACVPRYIQGVPDSMVYKKQVIQKQKVINIYKSISYNAGVTTESLINDSCLTAYLVKAIEDKGIKVNLYITFVSNADKRSVGATIKVKDSKERVNISKLSFTTAHPSMLRRLMIRFVEVCPDITNGFIHGYGKPRQPIGLYGDNKHGKFLISANQFKSVDNAKEWLKQNNFM